MYWTAKQTRTPVHNAGDTIALPNATLLTRLYSAVQTVWVTLQKDTEWQIEIAQSLQWKKARSWNVYQRISTNFFPTADPQTWRLLNEPASYVEH